MNEIKESWAIGIPAKAERWNAALKAARLELNVCDAIAPKKKMDELKGRKEIVEGSKHRRRQNKPDASMDMSPMWSLSSYKKRDFEMNVRNRKAIVAKDGRSIIVLGASGREWRIESASFCTWAARNPRKKDIVGFGPDIWMAIRNAEGRVR